MELIVVPYGPEMIGRPGALPGRHIGYVICT